MIHIIVGHCKRGGLLLQQSEIILLLVGIASISACVRCFLYKVCLRHTSRFVLLYWLFLRIHDYLFGELHELRRVVLPHAFDLSRVSLRPQGLFAWRVKLQFDYFVVVWRLAWRGVHALVICKLLRLGLRGSLSQRRVDALLL